MRPRDALRVLELAARKEADVARAEWRQLSNNGREFFRRRAALKICGRARLVTTDQSYRRGIGKVAAIIIAFLPGFVPGSATRVFDIRYSQVVVPPRSAGMAPSPVLRIYMVGGGHKTAPSISTVSDATPLVRRAFGSTGVHATPPSSPDSFPGLSALDRAATVPLPARRHSRAHGRHCSRKQESSDKKVPSGALTLLAVERRHPSPDPAHA